MRLSEQLFRSLIEKWPVGHLATITDSGRPHIVPIVFCHVDGVIYSPIDGKRKTTINLTRIKNLAKNPYATLLLDRYSDDWDSLWWVRIDAEAAAFTANADFDHTLRQTIERKHPQYTAIPSKRETSLWIKLAPVEITAWAQCGTERSIIESLEESPSDTRL